MIIRAGIVSCLAVLLGFGLAGGARSGQSQSRMQNRWLFVWRNMNDPQEVDRMIARFPAAKAAGYNGVAFSHNIPDSKASELKETARKYGIDLVAIVMGGGRDRNYVEGVLSKDALFIARGGRAVLEPDNPTRVVNGGFEESVANKMAGWPMQDDIGVTTFADTDVVHGGKASLRMEKIGSNPNGLCRLAQPIKLQPQRQYRISFWVKTENLTPAIPEVKVLTSSPQGSVSFQSFRVAATQDWKQYHLVFNSLDDSEGRIYLGTWGGKTGKLWWDDLTVDEIGLVNVLRRPGCPVTVRGENGAVYEEGRDFEKIVDPMFHPYIAYRGSDPAIKLTSTSRIKENERLRVSYYHPLVIYEDRLTYCVSEPKIFEDWKAEVARVNELLHPAAFFMSHDEMRVMNQCALCRGKNMTAGELLAWNVRKSAQIIRDIRPDAQIWVWNDMFDPMHNAVDQYYAVHGTLKGSWKGLDKDVGIVNWHGGLEGKNCRFFADLGLKQILSGYYDADEDGAGIAKWINNTRDVPGIVGAMYTTWEDKYGAMDRWAQKAWGRSPAQPTAPTASPPAGGAAGDAVLADAFRNQTRNIRVQGAGVVEKILSDDSKGSPHQRFILRLGSGQTVLVSHNIEIAPRVSPLRVGDRVSFAGEYEWNSKGGMIHWTHRDPDGRHAAGWLERQGKTYQ